ncbi:uracil-DNA glycosylase [Roseateles sp. BYS180W]|uniref:Uracil-DNA glycosylase n=1 Tax=Roseateles rivi TaxID=3299028 RepID=A0ABW7FWB8_9BURK
MTTEPHQQALWGDAAHALQQPIDQVLAQALSDPALDAAWRAPLQRWCDGAAGQALLAHVRARQQAGATIYPVDPFRAVRMTPLHKVRVVILGQDPYHGPGQAQGLAFSVPKGQALPPSLRNIYKELARDLGPQAWQTPGHGHLGAWAEAGVLLLNTCLTVEDGAPASHAKQGWEALTDAWIAAAAQHASPKVFLLWGAHAQAKATLLGQPQHLVLMANHPSPLSASRPPRPFIGCGHFSSAKAWLAERGETLSFELPP